MDKNFFLNNGYNIIKIKKNDAYFLRTKVIQFIKEKTKLKKINLNNLHKHYPLNKLNELRIYVYDKINKDKKFNKKINEIFDKEISQLVGSENVQSYISFSIQYPDDGTSLLTLHSDSTQSDSVFQANFWIPFVDVLRTKSMFIVKPSDSIEILNKMKNSKKITIQDVHIKYKKKMKWLKLNFGEAVAFTPNCLHGNVVNREKTTRISINLRFKNLYSPYVKNVGNLKHIENFYPSVNKKLITTINLKYPFDDFTK